MAGFIPSLSGVYFNLQTQNLPYREAVFDTKLLPHQSTTFLHPREIPTPWPIQPTATQAFILLTANKNLLGKYSTQSIDTLGCAAGVPPEKLVEDQGTFAGQLCIDCHAACPADRVKKHLHAESVPCKAGADLVTLMSVGGGSDKKAEAEVESSEDAEPVGSIDAKVGRLTEEVERSLSVVDGWKDNVMKDFSTQATRIARMVEADLRRENGEVRLMGQEKLGGAAADQPIGSSEDRTNLYTATRESEHLVKEVGSAGGEQLSQDIGQRSGGRDV
ncbi:hypothetical protein HOY82DRAFT_628977 [Tuber indicum]|nr:hypothetical protein HOY82DRAFT_628977 [Tuber indicum]